MNHTLFINLEHRRDRLAHVQGEFAKMQIVDAERVNAVKTKIGAIGCTMSHIRCIDLAIARQYDSVFICEDDITFLDPDTLRQNLKTFTDTVSDWDVCIVGGNNGPPYDPVHACYARVYNCQTTTGYIVRRHYYDTLKENFKESASQLLKDPQNKPMYALDVYWKRLQQVHKWYMITPPTVTQYENFSDIEQNTVNYGALMLDMKKEWLQHQPLLRILVNGFWPGFQEGTDGIHFGAFHQLFCRVFPNHRLAFAQSIQDADVLLESHFAPSLFLAKSAWKYTIFFSGEASHDWPMPTHKYTLVLGAQGSAVIPFPLFLLYEYCKPFDYSSLPPVVVVPPPKKICAIVSSDVKYPGRFRAQFVNELLRRGIHVDFGGKFMNNLGYTVPGAYFDQPILDFYKQYRVVLALENHASENYMTEKIINPLRAGTVPVYYGSERASTFINPNRFVQIRDVDQAIAEILRLCNDDEYWLQMVHQKPIFLKSTEECFEQVIRDMQRRI
jgi:hypothetical protein